jgi:multidrug efflux pump subunit AcrB
LDVIQKAAFVQLRLILITDIFGIICLPKLALSIGERMELLKTISISVIGRLIFVLLLFFLFLP